MPLAAGGLASSVAVLAVATAPVQGATLANWQFDPTSRGFSVVLPSGVTPRYLVAAEPARIILELPQTQLGSVAEHQAFAGAVSHVRLAQYSADTVRVVLELAPGTVLDPNHAQLVSRAEGGQTRWTLTPLVVDSSPIAQGAPTLSSGEAARVPTLPPPTTRARVEPSPVVAAPPDLSPPMASPPAASLPLDAAPPVASSAAPPAAPDPVAEGVPPAIPIPVLPADGPAPAAPAVSAVTMPEPEPEPGPEPAPEPEPAPTRIPTPVTAAPLDAPPSNLVIPPTSGNSIFDGPGRLSTSAANLILPTYDANLAELPDTLAIDPFSLEGAAPQAAVSVPSLADTFGPDAPPVAAQPAVPGPSPAGAASPVAIADDPTLTAPPPTATPTDPIAPIATAPTGADGEDLRANPPATGAPITTAPPIEPLAPTEPVAAVPPVGEPTVAAPPGVAPTVDVPTLDAAPTGDLPVAAVPEDEPGTVSEDSLAAAPASPVDASNPGASSPAPASPVPAAPAAPRAAVPDAEPALADSPPAPPFLITTAPPASPAPTGVAPARPVLTAPPPSEVASPTGTPTAEAPATLAAAPPAPPGAEQPEVVPPAPATVLTQPPPFLPSSAVPPAAAFAVPSVPAEPIAIAAAEPINFGQPLPGSDLNGTPAGDLAWERGAQERRPAPDVLLPAGTVLQLRYTGETPLELGGGEPVNQVLLLETEIRDPVTGSVVAPVGSQVVGQFQSSIDGQQWLSQVIVVPAGSQVPFTSRSEYMVGAPQVDGGGLALGTTIGAVALTVLTGFTGIGLVGGAVLGATAVVGTAPQTVVIEPYQMIEVQVVEDVSRSLPVAQQPEF